ncbi:unnamed protein product [Trifolium pratense]|uniref:Uncharacterized protein n=1 Tax=Trifolium pratense TaxID=57577 RepID=A0ACB0K874_TRIPR|nr:unnamed protein product [Trifolium pratense]
MSLVIQILLGKEDNPPSDLLQACPAPQTPQPWVIPQYQQQQNGYQRKNQSGPRNNSKGKNVHFDPVPIPYGQILSHLIQKGMVEPRSLPPVALPYPPHFDVNARCEYHAGSLGHNLEKCRAFKYKVQELIDRKLLTFKEESHGHPSP